MEPHPDRLKQRLEEAVRFIRAGEPAGFEVVVRELQTPLFIWLARRAHPGMDLEEVAQRIFLAVYGGLERYEAGTDFRAWFFTVARYQLMAELGRRQQENKKRGRWLAELVRRQREQLEQLDSPVDGQADTLERLRDCVDRLDAAHRNLVLLRHTEGHSLEEISRLTGRSLGAMKKQFWKIRLMLRRCLEAGDFFGRGNEKGGGQGGGAGA